MNETYLIDTHSHINMIKGADLDQIVKTAEEFGVKKIIVPSAYPADIDKIMTIVNKYKNVYGYLGVHPSEAKDWDDAILDKIREHAKSPKIVGIGEIGLDFYWDKSFNELQKEVFVKQINLANELDLPINVHDREAHKETFDLIQKHNKNSAVIMHCFSGSPEFAQECVKAGYYIALGGVVTFKNAKKMKEVAIETPLDRLLLENDAPYLTPMPHRGEENQPAYVKFVAEEIAKLRGISLEELAIATTQNAEKVLKL